MTEPIIPRLSDIVPREMLVSPLTPTAYHDAFTRFLRLFLVLITFLAFSVFSTVALFTFFGLLYAFLPFLMGCGLFLSLFFLKDAYSRQREDYEKQRITHQRVVLTVTSIIQNITIQQVTVNRGGTFLASGMEPPPAVSSAIPSSIEQPLRINDTYQLALKIASVGITAWNNNKGKRPTPKPISADAITSHYHVGREAWTESIQLLADAQVFDSPERPGWRPVVFDTDRAKGLLVKYLQSQGYVMTTYNQKETWIR